MKYIRPAAAAVLLIISDRITKILAAAYLKGTEGISVIPGVFRLKYLENRGSAFGMLQGRQTFFIIITVIVLVLLGILYLRLPYKRRMIPARCVIVLLWSGACGNFIDRIMNGYVVDFFYFELIDFPIFNVADVFVTVSAFLLIILVLFYYKDDDFAR